MSFLLQNAPEIITFNLSLDIFQFQRSKELQLRVPLPHPTTPFHAAALVPATLKNLCCSSRCDSHREMHKLLEWKEPETPVLMGVEDLDSFVFFFFLLRKLGKIKKNTPVMGYH